MGASGLLAAVLLVGATSPLWGIALVRLVADWAGYEVAVEEVEATGFSRWTLRGMTVRGPGFRLTADRLELPQFAPLARALWDDARRPAFAAGTVEVLVGGSGPGPDRTGEGREADWRRIGPLVEEWLPRLPEGSAEGLRILKPGEEKRGLLLAAENVRLKGRSLRARLSPAADVPAAGLELRLVSAERWQLTLDPEIPELSAFAEIRFTGEEAGVHAEVRSSGVPLSLSVLFPPTGGTFSGKLESTLWPIPGVLLPPQLSVVEKPRLTAAGRFTLADYELDAAVEGTGLRGAGMGEIPLVVKWQLRGNRESLTLRQLDLQWDWIEADLSDPVSYHFAEGTLGGTALFNVEADLGRQEVVDAAGRLRGRARLLGARWTSPRVEFEVSGEGVRYGDFPAVDARMEGIYAQPFFEVRELRVKALAREDEAGVSLTGRGQWNFATKEFSAEVEGRGDAESLPQPAGGVRLSGDLRLQASAEGRPADWTHRGSLQAGGVRMAPLSPFQTDFRWEGSGMESVTGTLQLQNADGDTLVTEAEFRRPGPSSWKLDLHDISLATGDAEALDLVEPVLIGGNWPLRGPPAVKELVLAAGSTRLSLSIAPAEKRLQLEAVQFSTDRLVPLLPDIDVPSLVVRRLSANLAVEAGGLAGGIQVDVVEKGPPLPLGLRLSADFTGESIRLRNVEGVTGVRDVMKGQLQLPFRVARAADTAGGPFRLQATGSGLDGELRLFLPGELAERYPSYRWLGALRGLEGGLSLGGSLEAPRGELDLRLDRSTGVGVLRGWLEKEPLRDLRLKASVSGEGIVVDEATGLWGGARLRLEGALPLAPEEIFRKGRSSGLRELADKLEARLEIPRMEIAGLAEVLPPLVRPEGTASANLTLRRGFRLQGEIHCRDWGLRSTLFTRPVENLNVQLAFDGRRIRIRDASGRMGLGELALGGWLRWSPEGELLYQLDLKGDRAPLVRTPNLLLRSDLDLTLSGGLRQPHRLSGRLDLRESVLLMDFDPLAPRTRKGPAANPPYFSIEEEPFADWELDVALAGEDFLQVRSPYFEALLSVQGVLQGTLREPVLLARLTTRDGSVLFPGARLTIHKGEFFTSREDPQTLRIDVEATGQQSSYVLSLRADGSAANPRVFLDATPPLSNARILRLLATGSLEGGGLGSLGIYLGKGAITSVGAGDGFWQRFSVEFGRDISESGQSTMDLYFDLTRNLYLHGQYDRYDEQNLDLVWEVFRR